MVRGCGALLSRTVARDFAWVKVWWMQGWSPCGEVVGAAVEEVVVGAGRHELEVAMGYF